MPRPIFLPSFAALTSSTRHWAIYIPSISNPTTGKVINVVGSPFTGFVLEFKRNYNLLAEARKFEKTLLTEVGDEFIECEEDGGEKESIDAIPRDRIEWEANEIDAPGVSRTPLEKGVENCQSWLWEYVRLLVKKGLVGEEALEVLGSAKA